MNVTITRGDDWTRVEFAKDREPILIRDNKVVLTENLQMSREELQLVLQEIYLLAAKQKDVACATCYSP